MICPVCDTETINKSNCRECEWEFVYFTDEPNQTQKKIYKKRLNEHIDNYEKNKSVVLTPEILAKDMFETTKEYNERLDGLGFVEIGTIELEDYDADTAVFTITCRLNENLKLLAFDLSVHDVEYEVLIVREEAKTLHAQSQSYKLVAKIGFIDDVVMIKALKFDQYVFIDNNAQDTFVLATTANAYEEQKVYTKAVECFKKSLEIDPEDEATLNALRRCNKNLLC